MQTKVILIVFDGCRPDALAQAHTPTVDVLRRAGAYTWSAQTVVPSWTLPTHMSMFRGVSPEKHGVQDNKFRVSANAFPSIFDVAHQAQLKTAMFYSWEELRDLSAHGSLDASYYRNCAIDSSTVDRAIAEQAATHLAAEQPDLTLVYLCESDLVGHEHGWMSPHYLTAIERMDRALGCVVDTLEQAHLLAHFTCLVLADHGGHDHTHGSAAFEDTTIPWLLSGKHVKRSHEIQTPVRIIDTAATIAHLLGLTVPAVWDGQPVWDAFDA
ncbi:MAG: alkaline phosphatase family protein [Anaerolineae bacterium]|nr:alkaline phosphatase family protein [Anaerolineae bacterium]